MQTAISGQEVESSENVINIQAAVDDMQERSGLILKRSIERMHVQVVNVEERLSQTNQEIEKLKVKVGDISIISTSMQVSQEFVLISMTSGRDMDEGIEGIKGGQWRRGLASPTEMNPMESEMRDP